MELKKFIDIMGLSIIAQLKTINKIDLYGQKEYEFLYGLNERHTSFRKMVKQLKRILWQK